MPAPSLMIGWEFPPHNSGGLGVACFGLTKALTQLAHPLTFALPTQLPENQVFARRAYRHTPTAPAMDMLLVHSDLQPYWQPHNHASGRGGVSMIEESHRYGEVIANIVVQEPVVPTLVHAHDWMSIPAALRVKQQTSKPLVLHIHSTEYDRNGGHTPSGPIAEIEFQGLNAADRIIAVSEYTKQIIAQEYHVPLANIDVVHNGVDPNPAFHDQPLSQFLGQRPIVAFVGRLTIQKGPEYFIKVAQVVIAEKPDAVFVIAGWGELAHALMLTAAANGLSKSVLFAGFLRDKERQQLLNRINVFVMPSISEPFGIAALEAAMAKKPVIVSKTAGVAEVLPHAFPVDFWDVDKMKATILELIEKTAESSKIGQSVANEAAHLTWQDAGQKVLNLYQKLLQ